MARTTLTISSKNYSSWSLRGWLLARLAGLDFDELVLPADDVDAKAEILLLAPSILVPCLHHDGVTVWDTLAIAEYLAEIAPKAGLLPAERGARAHCRAICGEMHSGFASLRSALPMNLKGHAIPASGPGAARRPTSSACSRSGRIARRSMAGPVSVRRPSRHGRRRGRAGSSRACEPMTSRWPTARSPSGARASSRCPRCGNGRPPPRWSSEGDRRTRRHEF